MLCPLCGKKLEIKQINLNTAILLCSDLQCPYPVGSECIQITRNLEEIDTKCNTLIQPDSKYEVNNCTSVNSTANGQDIKKEENDVFAALEDEIKKLSQGSQINYNGEFNVMEFINDNNNSGMNGNNNSANPSATDLGFDMDDFLQLF